MLGIIELNDRGLRLSPETAQFVSVEAIKCLAPDTNDIWRVTSLKRAFC